MHRWVVLLVVGVVFPSTAWAQPATGPWSSWCVAPACSGTPGAPPLSAPLARLTEPGFPGPPGGVLESALQQQLLASLDDVVALAGQAKVGRDLFANLRLALADSLAQGRPEAAGMTGAVLRAGLTYALDGALAPSASCRGDERLDALYEALAGSRLTGGMEFPARDGQVASGCRELAGWAQALLDVEMAVALLAREQLTPATLRSDRESLESALRVARQMCATAPWPEFPDVSAADVTAIQLSRAIEGAARVATTSDLSPECHAQLQRLAPSPTLQALQRLGMAEVPLRAAEASFREWRFCPAGAACGPGVDAVVGFIGALEAGRLEREAFVALVRIATARLHGRLASSEGSVLYEALADAVVVDARTGARVEPQRWLGALRRHVPSFVPTRGISYAGFIVDGDLGATYTPQQVRFNGAGSVGYEGERFGLWTRGERYIFSLRDDARDLLDTRVAAEFEGWVRLGSADDELRWLVTCQFDYGEYENEVTVLDATGVTDEELSAALRAGLGAGLQWAPSARWTLRARGGAAVQKEDFEQQVVVVAGPELGGRRTESASFSAHGRLRVLLRYELWPSILSASLLNEAKAMRFTRSSAVYAYDLQGAATRQTAAVASERLESRSRLVFALDALAIGDSIRPALYGEFATVRVSNGRDTLWTQLPGAGALLRSTLPF